MGCWSAAWAGLTETQAARDQRRITVAKFPWGASGRAITLDRTDGLTKLILDPETERILGVGLVGPGAGELIAEGVLAIEMGANATDLKLSIHPHPTLTETMPILRPIIRRRFSRSKRKSRLLVRAADARSGLLISSRVCFRQPSREMRSSSKFVFPSRRLRSLT